MTQTAPNYRIKCWLLTWTHVFYSNVLMPPAPLLLLEQPIIGKIRTITIWHMILNKNPWSLLNLSHCLFWVNSIIKFNFPLVIVEAMPFFHGADNKFIFRIRNQIRLWDFMSSRSLFQGSVLPLSTLLYIIVYTSENTVFSKRKEVDVERVYLTKLVVASVAVVASGIFPIERLGQRCTTYYVHF